MSKKYLEYEGLQDIVSKIRSRLKQYETMPVASVHYLDRIVQYIGATTSSYINGQFYKCQEVSGSSPTAYSWVLISGNSLNTLDDVELTNLSDKQILTWDDTNSKWVNEDNNALKQYSTMPNPSADYLGKIVQYVGATDANYTHGFSYECALDNGSYVWKESTNRQTLELVDVEWSQYFFDGSGNTGSVLHTDGVATPKLTDSGLYLVTFPDDLFCFSYNAIRTDGVRANQQQFSPISKFIEHGDFFRVAIKRKDGGELLPTDPLVSQIKIYLLRSLNSDGVVTVAANDTIDDKKKYADIVLDGTNDTRILAALTACYDSITVKLLNGTYNITEMWSFDSTTKIALSFNIFNFDGGTGYRRYINICGENPSNLASVFGSSATLKVSTSLHNSLETSGKQYFILGSPYTMGNADIQRLAVSTNIKNINILGHKYDKPLTYIDTTRCLSSMIEYVNVRSWDEVPVTSYDGFNNTPNTECCGIRVGRGSNYGVQNFVKYCNVWYCGKAYACSGEHFIFEGDKAHTDYIGFVFGDRKTIGKMEHPNIMIGCAIEGCYRLMLLTKNGETIEREAPSDMSKSTLVCIGTDTEDVWKIPVNEQVTGEPTTQRTLPILDIVKRAYRGSIEIDWHSDSVFETGGGEFFTTTLYENRRVETSTLVKRSELPTPSSTYEGQTYLLTAPQTGYIEGGIYKCEEVTPSTSPKTYYWKLINGNGIEYHAGNGIEINGDEISTNIKHYTTMPTNEELFAMSDLTVFETDGFYEQRDGCGGKYIIAVNGLRGGLELNYNNETRWLCILDDYGNPANEINICKYGVREFVGDITANNITKENTYATYNSYVVTHIRLMRQGGTYKFPKGKFVFADPLDLRERNITFEGAYPPINGTDNYFTGSDYSSCTVLCFPFLQNGECAITTRFNLINLCVYGNYNTYDISFDRTKTITAPNEVVTETIAESNGEQIKCTGIKVSAQSVIQNVTVTGFYTGIERPNPSNGYYFNLFFERCHYGIKFKNDTKCLGLYGYRVYTLAQVNGSICSIDQARVDECVHAIEILQGRDITINDLDGDYCTKELVVIGANDKATLVQGLRLENIHGRFSVLKSYDITQLPNGYDVRELVDTDGYGMIRLTDKVDFKDSHVSINYVVSNPFDDTSNYLVPNIMFTFPTNTYYDITNNIFEIGDNITTSEDILKIFQTKSSMTARVDCGSRTYYINGSTVEHDIVESDLGTAATKNFTDRVQPNSTDLVESQSVYSAINSALSSIYTPRGDITCAELTSDLLITANVGNVYELSDSGTTSALFLQGAGITLNAGDNVGIINAGEGRILFNLMANAFDLTDYQKKDLTTPLTIGGVSVTTVEGALSALNDEMVEFTQAELLAMW